MNKRLMRTICILATLTVLASACSLTEVCPTAEPCPTAERCPIPAEKPSLVGTWEADVGGTAITFVFEASGGFKYYMEGVEVNRGQYALLETIEPKGITIVFEDGDVLYPIYEFITADSMRLQNVYPGDPRPISFTDALTFRRKNP